MIQFQNKNFCRFLWYNVQKIFEGNFMKAILYFHGKGGNIFEAEHYKKFFPEAEIIGVDYKKKYAARNKN